MMKWVQEIVGIYFVVKQLHQLYHNHLSFLHEVQLTESKPGYHLSELLIFKRAQDF